MEIPRRKALFPQPAPLQQRPPPKRNPSDIITATVCQKT